MSASHAGCAYRLTRLASLSSHRPHRWERSPVVCVTRNMNLLHGKPRSTLRFELEEPDGDIPCFGPRLGTATLQRPGDSSVSVTVETPAMITSTSRGVVPHLSRDHQASAEAICWMNVPIESFLEHRPPIPLLFQHERPLHGLFGFAPKRNVVVMSLRDPADTREMPPNSNTSVNAFCVRGVRKLTPPEWTSHALSANPDIVVAISDTPFTKPPHSQKRLQKSIERSLSWLAALLHPVQLNPTDTCTQLHPLNVFVHMAGGVNEAARSAFADGLLETLYHKEAEVVAPLRTLDAGVAGYTFDLAPLCQAILVEDESYTRRTTSPTPLSTRDLLAQDVVAPLVGADVLAPLLRASLHALPRNKVRLVNGVRTPHELLALVRDVGVDFFDSRWAQRAADIGIALDFCFPARVRNAGSTPTAIGHNLYESRYADDFGRLADAFLDGQSAHADASAAQAQPVCPCIACSPMPPTHVLTHSTVDPAPPAPELQPPYTRAYVHHLLHTHEMGAHALLVAHNLAVCAALLSGVRGVLRADSSGQAFAEEVERFGKVYDGGIGVYAEAVRDWAEVERARGRGRLQREQLKQEQTVLGTAVQL